MHINICLSPYAAATTLVHPERRSWSTGTGPSCMHSTSGEVLARSVCISSLEHGRTTNVLMLSCEHSFHVIVLYVMLPQLEYAGRRRSRACCNWTLAKAAGAQHWASAAMRHGVLTTHSLSPATENLPPFRSYNDMGAGGAEELVKGDWPELRLLDIWWGGLV
jgi:hypothetical protein